MIKVFRGLPKVVEAEYNQWNFKRKREIVQLVQSESQGEEGLGITLTVLYKY